MSKFNKCILVGAIALAFSTTALADGSVTATNGNFAWNVTGGTTPNPTAETGGVAFTVAAPDILIGRSSGTGQITVEATLVGAEVGTAVVQADIAPQAGAAVNTVSSAAGASAFQFTMTPPAAPGFVAGDLFTINGIDLEDASGLASLGGTVTIAFVVKDTTTGTVLSSATAEAVLTSVEATTTTLTGANSTIDVFSPSLKTLFNGALDTVVATLGTVAVGVRDLDSITAGTQAASTAGTGALTNDNAGSFQFDAAADEIDLELTVPNASAFAGAGNGFYADTAACSDPAPGTGVAFVVDATDATKYTASVPVNVATGVTYNICAVADGTNEIAAQTIGLSAQINLAGALTQDPAAVEDTDFAVLSYNGPVVDVRSFNPASNAAVDSLVRIINTSSVGGTVSIDSRCQDGATRGPISFTLAGNNAVQYSSSELESGTAGAGKPALSGGLGACAAGGRSSLTITGQIPSMEVQNFLRSITSAGTVTAGNSNDEN